MDLRSAYQNAAANEQLFLRNDTHWSPRGAELAAQTLAKQFPELQGETPYLTQAVSEKEVTGDLLNYLKFDPRLAPSYFEPVHIQLYETLQQSRNDLADSLFGEEAVSLALVGTTDTAAVGAIEIDRNTLLGNSGNNILAGGGLIRDL